MHTLEASGSKPVITNISPPASSSDDSGTEESPTLGNRNSDQIPSLDTEHSLAESSSMEQLEMKSTEKGKEGDAETPEDITKQVSLVWQGT